ncbi:MAG: winged helix-turn-helix transcriptional regulator [Actinomycetales bacterium]|nr:winged helix-turn-helix transcriptional regulator [Actinomycetales bacterium]
MLNTELPVAQLKAELFKALGHPLRIRLLEQLVDGERSVGVLAEELDADLASVSQQLGVLRRAGVVITRREGSSVHYSLRDPGMPQLLSVARAMIVADLRDSRALLAELEQPADAARS